MQDDSKLIKLKNYENIYSLFFQNQSFSKPQVADALKLSLPTVMANISRLEKKGLIYKCELLESSGGRPATGYRLVQDAKVSIGVKITSKKVKCAVIDLKSSICNEKDFDLVCDGSDEYVDGLCKIVSKFIESQNYTKEQIIGIGFSLEAIVNTDCSEIIYSKILPLSKISAKVLEEKLNYKVKIYHDVECAATAELWNTENISNAIYISINEHLGGALIQNHHIEHGINGYAGALEHLEVVENGRKCYCGKNGCLETYCSVYSLLNDKESLEEFFTNLRSEKIPGTYTERWNSYMQMLAKGLYSIYLLLERDLILGGLISSYLIEADIKQLEDLIIRRGSFDIKPGFIRIAKIQSNSVVTGAALNFIGQALPKSLVPVKM